MQRASAGEATVEGVALLPARRPQPFGEKWKWPIKIW